MATRRRGVGNAGLAAAWAVAGWVALAGAAAPDVDAVARLQSWLDATVDLEARFEQTLVSGALGAGAMERGRFFLERPGRLRWDYAAPDEKVALLIGDRTSLYLASDRQMIRGRLEPDEALLPRLLAGTEPIRSLFVTETLAGETDGTARIRLKPRGEDGGLSWIVLTIRLRDGAVEAAEVMDPAGNRTVYKFRSLRRNTGLPPGVFAFEPPAGTEIVQEGP